MADEWFWQPDRLPPTRSLVPANPGPLPVPQMQMRSSVLQVNVTELDQSYQLAVTALLEMLSRTPLRTSVVTYDPRLEVIRAYFIAYGRNDLDVDDLSVLVQAEVLSMHDAPLAAVLGCEMAKAGFLCLGLPRHAAVYAREAARGWTALGRLAEASRREAEQLALPEGATFDWERE